MINLRLETRARVVGFAVRSQKLMALDAISTAALTSTTREKLDLGTLRLIGTEMEYLLAYCAREASWLDTMVGSHRQEFLTTFREAIEASPLDGETKGMLRAKLLDNERLLAHFHRAAQDLPGLAWEETQYLRKQITAAEAGGATTGDLRRETLCALEGAGVGALLFLNPAAAIGVALKVATDCL
jgi:hypothetical protein